MKVSYLLIVILFISSACNKNKNCNKSIKIKNKSSLNIMIDAENHYKRSDSLFYCPFNSHKNFILKTNDSLTFETRGCWQNVLDDGTTFDLFVIDIKNYDLRTPCDTVKKNCKVLFRKQYTLEDLEKINFKISYE